MPNSKRSRLALMIVAFFVSVTAAAKEDSYVQKVEHWHHKWDEFMRSKNSPLVVVGRFAVIEGESSIGSDPASAIALPPGAPEHLGTLVRHEGNFSFKGIPGLRVSVNGKRIAHNDLASDPITLRVAAKPQPSDKVGFGRWSFSIRPEHGSYYLYFMDQKHPKEFKGIDWFPIDTTYRVTAQLIPEDTKRTVTMVTPDGIELRFPAVGELVFEVGGQKLHLQAVATGNKAFGVFFWDKSSGKETYGGGRSVEGDMPIDGDDTVILDFNYAANPYCAYSHFSSCVLPQKENRLDVPILAGAKYRMDTTSQ
jgi:uncharacterized protein